MMGKQQKVPRINHQQCTRCGLCVEICPDRVLHLEADLPVMLLDEHCMGCNHCYAVCPVNAVVLSNPESMLRFRTFERKTLPTPTRQTVTTAELALLMELRRSCRKFKAQQEVEISVLSDLISLGTTAPSGTNNQGWQFIIIPERKDVMALGEATATYYRQLNNRAASPWWRFLAKLFAKDGLSHYYQNYYQTIEEGLRVWQQDGTDRLFHGAPSAIVVAGDIEASCPAEDALLATQNILLAAETMGVGTCLIGFVVEAARRDKRIRKLLRLAANEQIYSVIACGYPAITFQRAAGRANYNPRVLRLSKSAMKKDDSTQNVASDGEEKRVSLVVYSFGFKHGVPVDANMVWDVRFLPNPYWQEELRPMSGQEQPVADFVIESEQGQKFLELLKPMLEFLIDSNSKLEKKNLRFAVGCTGGRHRSVAIVEEIKRFLTERDVDLTVFHRDMERES
ncbi:MAG: hypothetical protein D6B25_04115 [Desulfobulbaceae bacterium]|nr:MAG: hypothetical protein D6B25_04115 [Desulfobulbaceae bacterium]